MAKPNVIASKAERWTKNHLEQPLIFRSRFYRLDMFVKARECYTKALDYALAGNKDVRSS